MQPPIAPSRPVELHTHDETRVDEFSWLREKESPEVIAHLEAENAFTFSWLDRETGDLREKLYKELLARVKEDDQTAPVWMDDYRYYSRTELGKPYQIHCRAPRAGGEETVLIDLNEMSDGGFIQIGGYWISPNHRHLVYGVDRDGSEIYTLQVLDTQTMQILEDRIGNAYGQAAWIDDERFLYTVLDETHRPHRVLEHRLGTDPSQDREIFHEPNKRCWVRIERSADDRWLLISSDTSTSGETRYASTSDPYTWEVVSERKEGIEYDVIPQGDRFLIRTNDGAPEFKLLTWVPGSDSVQGLIEGRDDVTLEQVEAFDGAIAIIERIDGLKRFSILFEDGSRRDVEMPEPVYELFIGPNAEFRTRKVRLLYSSMIRPQTSYDLDMDSGELEVIKQEEVPGGYDPDLYATERLSATARDGTSVPISLVYRKDRLRKPGPLMLYGYGSYGVSIPASFTSRRLPLLDRGVAFAIAHIRGGGDMGERWRNDGKLMRKMNTFTDFIDCAEHLFAEGWTSPPQLAIGGGSAGGLLIGAVLNLRPDLCKAAVAWVPFVDSLNTMLDDSLPLTVNEYEEWGDPSDPEVFRYMRSYAPYENVAEGIELPSVLATAGLNDPRVSYWEPAKWVQRLRARASNDPIVLMYTNMGAGHAGAADRYEDLRERAIDQAFVLHQLGCADIEP